MLPCSRVSASSGDAQQQPDLGDTFLDAQHVLDSFPLTSTRVVIAQQSGSVPGHTERVEATAATIKTLLSAPPYHVTVETAQPAAATAESEAVTTTDVNDTTQQQTVVIRNTVKVNPGPFPQDVPPVNRVRFTASQVRAIHSGIQPGLTMIVGPPGECQSASHLLFTVPLSLFTTHLCFLILMYIKIYVYCLTACCVLCVV